MDNVNILNPFRFPISVVSNISNFTNGNKSLWKNYFSDNVIPIFKRDKYSILLQDIGVVDINIDYEWVDRLPELICVCDCEEDCLFIDDIID